MLNFDFWKALQSFLNFFKRLLLAHWRSLLVLLTGVLLPLLIFEQLAVIVWRSGGSLAFDDSLLLSIHTTVTPRLDTIAAILTKFGVYWGVVPVGATIAVVLLYLRRWRSLTFLLLTLIGNGVINRVAKALLHRVRPHLWESLAPELDYGFPSGHAMSSMSFVAALVILMWGSRWCWLILVFGGAFVISIGWTRLYLGVHFPSDILAGWLVAIAWAVGVSLVIRLTLTKASPVIKEVDLTVSESIAQG